VLLRHVSWCRLGEECGRRSGEWSECLCVLCAMCVCVCLRCVLCVCCVVLCYAVLCVLCVRSKEKECVVLFVGGMGGEVGSRF